MVALKNLALLAGASSVLAAPQWGNGGWGHHGNVVTQNDVVWTTVMVTVTAGQEPTPTPQVEQPSPPAAQVTEAPQPEVPQASSTPSAASSNSGSTGGYMDTVNEWRGKMGLSSLSSDGTLEANALKTARDSGGQLNHELNPGSMAQVLAPGDPSEFVKVFVGGWLCELPGSSGMDGICGTMSQGWSYDGQTGHAEILRSTSYSKIGCACDSNIWACDLA